MNTQDIKAIEKDAADKNTEGGLEHAILRWFGLSDMITRVAGGKVPGFVAPAVQTAVEIIKASKRKGKAKTSGKTTAKDTK